MEAGALASATDGLLYANDRICASSSSHLIYYTARRIKGHLVRHLLGIANSSILQRKQATTSTSQDHIRKMRFTSFLLCLVTATTAHAGPVRDHALAPALAADLDRRDALAPWDFGAHWLVKRQCVKPSCCWQCPGCCSEDEWRDEFKELMEISADASAVDATSLERRDGNALRVREPLVNCYLCPGCCTAEEWRDFEDVSAVAAADASALARRDEVALRVRDDGVDWLEKRQCVKPSCCWQCPGCCSDAEWREEYQELAEHVAARAIEGAA